MKVFVIISILFLANTFLFSNVKITDKGENFAEINITEESECFVVLKTNPKDSIAFKSLNKSVKFQETIDFANAESLANGAKLLFKSTKPGKFVINNLNPKSDYIVDLIYEKKAPLSTKFSTLAPEPTKQAHSIVFKTVDAGNLSFHWMKGNGENCIAVMRKGAAPVAPIDGVEYTANAKFGSANSQIADGSYVVFKGYPKSIDSVMISNLEYGLYHIHLYEYNGAGKYANYNSKSSNNNPRRKHTALKAPVINSAKLTQQNTIQLNWDFVPMAETYILDVAFDKSFINLLEFYNSADIGNLNEYEIAAEDAGNSSSIFIRLQAKDSKTTSNYSKTYEFKLNKKK